jgi:hydrogenase maturation protease
MGAKKVSMHQAGFQEVLSSAVLTGDFPDEIALIGVQPEVLNDYGGSLTDAVKSKVEPAVELALGVLGKWDVAVTPRAEPLQSGDLIGPGALDIGDYERGRPAFNGE